jgi:hypothetical protein
VSLNYRRIYMSTTFITTAGGRIVGHHNGDINADFFGTPYYGLERMEVPEKAGVIPGEPLDYYNTLTWERKTDAELIDAGIMPMPEGYIREGHTLRKMSREERIVAGLDEPEAGTKVENGKIVPMTLEERREAGLISGEQYTAIKTGEAQTELDRRIAVLNTEEARAMAEFDGSYAAERKAKLLALLAVKQQPGWPINIQWPVATVDSGLLPGAGLLNAQSG